MRAQNCLEHFRFLCFSKNSINSSGGNDENIRSITMRGKELYTCSTMSVLRFLDIWKFWNIYKNGLEILDAVVRRTGNLNVRRKNFQTIMWHIGLILKLSDVEIGWTPFLEGSKLLYKMIFQNDDLHIILKRRNLAIC